MIGGKCCTFFIILFGIADCTGMTIGYEEESSIISFNEFGIYY